MATPTRPQPGPGASRDPGDTATFTWEVRKALAEGNMVEYQKAIQHMIDTQDLESGWFMNAFSKYIKMNDLNNEEKQMYYKRAMEENRIARELSQQMPWCDSGTISQLAEAKYSERFSGNKISMVVFDDTEPNVMGRTEPTAKVQKGAGPTPNVKGNIKPTPNVKENTKSCPNVKERTKTTPQVKNEGQHAKTHPHKLLPSMKSKKRVYREPFVPEALLFPESTFIRSMDPPLVYVDIRSIFITELDIYTIQIGAVGPNGLFHRYVIPHGCIHRRAAEETQMKYKDGVMYFRDRTVHAVLPEEAATDFLDYLGDEPVILAGHDCKSIVSQRLLDDTNQLDVDLEEIVYGFLDTLPMFDALHPFLKSYLQPDLYKHFFPMDTYDEKNALDGAQALKRLVEHACSDPCTQIPHTFTVDLAEEIRSYNFMTSVREASWRMAIDREFVSPAVARRAAASGLEVDHLHWAFEQRGGRTGVRAVLTENVHGQPRVSWDPQVLEGIIEYIEINKS